MSKTEFNLDDLYITHPGTGKSFHVFNRHDNRSLCGGFMMLRVDETKIDGVSGDEKYVKGQDCKSCFRKAGLVLSALLITLLLGGCEAGFRFESRSSTVDSCPTIPHDQATGSIRCWSGGELVYGNYIYHSGGVLCSSDGKEIKITGGKSLCVIESNQDSAWEPLTEQLTPAP